MAGHTVSHAPVAQHLKIKGPGLALLKILPQAGQGLNISPVKNFSQPTANGQGKSSARRLGQDNSA